ncbi:GNAT family N-acetyltransferase [Caproiciproducens faecalis]|uniref:GNAT family N-acetyltransferase n=1 Tax=Caproiciproducens faecalis TaxID=2820301 RepID=A0ABS7DQR1_9FIRM|nr:GNAT family N-acetyltransferase [Caproiciproducens faecalis]MBW7573637.1 GNAT family N-acetyltransferase [Caproiciproducens faecalis]
MENVKIRVATEQDAEELLAIYAPYVRDTAITFEYEIPTAEEFRSRIRNTLKRYPYLVATADGVPIGYAYVSAFHKRAAYDWAVETSVYLKMNCKKQGIGKKLYLLLEEIAKEQHILNMNACIAFANVEDRHLTNDSVRFHEHLGYKVIGHFTQCGYKFDKWYDMIWMEKMIGNHTVHPEAVIPFSEVRQKFGL